MPNQPKKGFKRVSFYIESWLDNEISDFAIAAKMTKSEVANKALIGFIDQSPVAITQLEPETEFLDLLESPYLMN